MRHRLPSSLLAIALTLALAVAAPRPVQAQGAAGLLRSIQQGGGWVAIPIEDGSGTLRTDTIPTLGLTLAGCVQVWPGHSGEWTIQARDPVNGGHLDATAEPGQGVPFSYRTGMRSLLDVNVRWSEPRDTTLLLWVGLDGVPGRSDACEPVYGGG
jgi:hypothetical protein